jgi:hypothetical protein
MSCPSFELPSPRLIRPRRLRTGRSIQRMLSRGQVLYLRLEAEGVRLLPIAARRAIAKKIESSPEVDAVVLTEGSAVVIQVKSVRLELDLDLRKLERAENIIVSDPEIMRGTPVYRSNKSAKWFLNLIKAALRLYSCQLSCAKRINPTIRLTPFQSYAKTCVLFVK